MTRKRIQIKPIGSKVNIGDVSGINRSIIAGRDVSEVTLGDKITVGDISSSYNAIGAGAQIIVNQTRSRIEELDKEAQMAERRLAEAIIRKVEDYTRLTQKRDLLNFQKRTDLPNPYKALLDYKLEDAPLFYGREEAIGALLANLQNARLTILHSESGAGKSSILQAGLAARLLARGHLPLYLRPYNQSPSLVIKKAFLPDLEILPELQRLAGISLLGFLSEISRQLHPGTLYLFLDQFEEFFIELDAAQQKQFAQDLAACLNEPGLNVCWLLSLRKEHFADLSIFRPDILNPFENDYFLRSFSHVEATEVITQPARQSGIVYETGLVENILADLSQDSQELAPPQVQLVCYTLFEELKGTSHPQLITYQLYQKERGRGGPGARGILSSHLSRVLDETMTATERKIARQVLKALVSSQGRRLLKSETTLLAEVGYPVSLQILMMVLKLLVDNRLLHIYENEDELLYELAHDYLLAEIEIDPATQARKAAQEILNQEVTLWHNNPKLLIPADKLDIIEAYNDSLIVDDDAQTLLTLSQTALKRRRQFVFAGAGVVTILLIAAMVLGILIIAAQRNLDMIQRTTASITKANLSLSSHDPEKAMRYGIEAVITVQKDQEIPAHAQKALFQSLNSPLQAVLEGHTDRILGVCFSPDGRYLATGSWDNTTRIWEVETGQEVRTLAGQTGAVRSINFSPNGRYLAIGSGDNNTRIWEVDTGQVVRVLRGHTSDVVSVSFSPDGRYLATGSLDDTARIWEVETGQKVRVLEASTIVDSVSFSPDSRYLATGGWGNTAQIWDVATGQVVQVLEGHTLPVLDVSFSPNGQYLVTTSSDTTARIWDVTTGKEVRVLEGHTGYVLSASFSPDGQYLATGSEDYTARIWEVETGQQVRILEGHTDAVFSVSFSTDGKYLATASSDTTARIWKVNNAQELHILRGSGFPFSSVSFSPDERYLATAGDDARIWDVTTGKEVRVLKEHDSVISDVSFSPDGRYLATAGDDARIWEVETGQEVHILKGHTSPVWSVSFSPDGQYLATSSLDHTVRIWEMETGQEIHILDGHDFGCPNVNFNFDGRFLATACDDGTARIWEVKTGQEVSILKQNNPINDVSFSPDGRCLATACDDNTARIWELETGQEVRIMEGHTNPVGDVSFSPDGQYLATSSLDHTVRIWEVKTGQEVRILEEHTDSVWDVSFSPSGRYLATVSKDNTARLWAFPTIEEMIAEAKRRIRPSWRAELEGNEHVKNATDVATAEGQ